MVRQDSDFRVMLIYETKTKKPWPEKSAGRALAIAGGSFDFSGSFGYFSIRGKVTRCLNIKQKPEKEEVYFSRIGLRQYPFHSKE